MASDVTVPDTTSAASYEHLTSGNSGSSAEMSARNKACYLYRWGLGSGFGGTKYPQFGETGSKNVHLSLLRFGLIPIKCFECLKKLKRNNRQFPT